MAEYGRSYTSGTERSRNLAMFASPEIDPTSAASVELVGVMMGRWLVDLFSPYLSTLPAAAPSRSSTALVISGGGTAGVAPRQKTTWYTMAFSGAAAEVAVVLFIGTKEESEREEER